MGTLGKRQRLDETEYDKALRSPLQKNRRLDACHDRKSPWQLTWIRDLPEELNKDAVTLHDILGDALINECWEFNFLHDIDFLMDAFDPDTRHLVDVHVVHGFWKREDPQRMALSLAASAYNNVKLHVAPMPEMFGTHHSKMMILFRHDDTVEVVIHTANMIAKDWTNMTNAVWRSPRLPRAAEGSQVSSSYEDLAIGSGDRFKADLLSYLRCYDGRVLTCKPLADKLSRYDFSAVRAALVASAPGVHDGHDLSHTPFGWSAMKRYLKAAPCQAGSAEVVVQISSIATLGGKDSWLQETLFDALASGQSKGQRPRFKIVFPTADEVRRSLDGYASGGSIHTRIQSAQQAQQMKYLQPILHHWANDCDDGAGTSVVAHTLLEWLCARLTLDDSSALRDRRPEQWKKQSGSAHQDLYTIQRKSDAGLGPTDVCEPFQASMGWSSKAFGTSEDRIVGGGRLDLARASPTGRPVYDRNVPIR
ncbi:hypothetical protein E4U32_004625 [Claviceps aff. humidiphila group G2b]|nr:hypothetical protein E4U32_004625 [Claviceps aff. humidiphila group G2b]